MILTHLSNELIVFMMQFFLNVLDYLVCVLDWTWTGVVRDTIKLCVCNDKSVWNKLNKQVRTEKSCTTYDVSFFISIYREIHIECDAVLDAFERYLTYYSVCR